MAKAFELLRKSSFEEKYFDFSFAGRLKVGETISSVTGITATPTTSPVLTIGTPAISGSLVQAKFSGGLSGTRYHVTCQIVTSTQKRELCGDLLVFDCPS